MRKRLLLGLVTLSAASMLCGFDSAETAESIFDKMTEASASAAAGGTAGLVLDFDAALNVSDGETTSQVPITFGMDFTTAFSMEPFAMSMEGSYELSALLQKSQVLKMYAAADDDGSLKAYSYIEDSATGEGEWTVDSDDSLNITELLANSQNAAFSFADMQEMGLTFELAPEAAEANGTECYLLSTTIDASTLDTMMQKATEITGQELPETDSLDTALALLEGLNMNLEYYVDTATYLPVSIHMDLDGSDLSALNTLIGAYMSNLASEDAPASTVDFVINNCALDMNFDYSSVPEITIPEEALAAENNASAASES